MHFTVPSGAARTTSVLQREWHTFYRPCKKESVAGYNTGFLEETQPINAALSTVINVRAWSPHSLELRGTHLDGPNVHSVVQVRPELMHAWVGHSYSETPIAVILDTQDGMTGRQQTNGQNGPALKPRSWRRHYVPGMYGSIFSSLLIRDVRVPRARVVRR